MSVMRRFVPTLAMFLLALASAAALIALAQSPEPQQQASGAQEARRQVDVPFPGSTRPAEVLANVVQIVRQTRIGATIEGMRERLLAPGLRARRMLQVTAEDSRQTAFAYVVVELEDAKGAPVAIVGVSAKDEPMGIEDFRGGVGEPTGDPATFRGDRQTRPLDLADAATRVKQHLDLDSVDARYVHFSHRAERGISLFRPLVALQTSSGVVYVNSTAQAFAEPSSPIARTRGIEPTTTSPRPGVKELVLLVDLRR